MLEPTPRKADLIRFGVGASGRVGGRICTCVGGPGRLEQQDYLVYSETGREAAHLIAWSMAHVTSAVFSTEISAGFLWRRGQTFISSRRLPFDEITNFCRFAVGVAVVAGFYVREVFGRWFKVFLIPMVREVGWILNAKLAKSIGRFEWGAVVGFGFVSPSRIGDERWPAFKLIG